MPSFLEDVDYPDDCERIARVARAYGRHISLSDAARIWKKYSDDFAAGWLGLPDHDEDIWRAISWAWEGI